MLKNDLSTQTGRPAGTENGARGLLPEQIAMINEALGAIGEYGEVRLVIEKGQIRFLEVIHSYDALKWRPRRIVNVTE